MLKFFYFLLFLSFLFIMSCDDKTDAQKVCSNMNKWLEKCGGQCRMVDECETNFNNITDPDEKDFWKLYSKVFLSDLRTCPHLPLGYFYREKANESMGLTCNFYCGDGVCPNDPAWPNEKENLETCPEDCSIKYCSSYPLYTDELMCADTETTSCRAPKNCPELMAEVATTDGTPITAEIENCMISFSLSNTDNCFTGTTSDGTSCDEFIFNLIPPVCVEN